MGAPNFCNLTSGFYSPPQKLSPQNLVFDGEMELPSFQSYNPAGQEHLQGGIKKSGDQLASHN